MSIDTPNSSSSLLQRFRRVRALSRTLCEPLQIEDYCLQSMEEASPPKWHLAHTTWFFEQFVLQPELGGYRVFDEAFSYLFNSYYQQVGRMHPRPQRGLLTRPALDEVRDYRTHVDAAIEQGLASESFSPRALSVIEVGTHHEQQHQELLLTDLKHGFFQNPTLPAYRQKERGAQRPAADMSWVEHEGGVVEVGFSGDGFHFDNEGPPHRVFAEPFALASRLITVGEYQNFIADGGYRRSELWLSEGWHLAQSEGWTRPLYWLDDNQTFSLDGVRALDPGAPVTHLSYYEADAYAHWTGFRLPTEYDWEVMARQLPIEGNFVESGALHPVTADAKPGLQQMFGDAWEWTQSAYSPYPAYRAPPGAIGEYNGKFMVNQMILRGGSCVSPRDHLRATYRNFFPASARWQFSGIRLARDL